MAAVQPRTPLPATDHKPSPYTGPSRDEMLALRRQYINPGIFTFYKEPLPIVEGHMQYLWDDRGRRYLDAIAGIVTVSVGHAHPRIVQRVREQVGKLSHTTTIYLHPTIGQYGKLLAEHFPDGSDLSVTYFTNSGSEANELATMMARLYTGNCEVIALRNAYHGGLQGSRALTAHGAWNFPLPRPAGVLRAACGYCYRCPMGLEYPSCKMRCATDVEQIIEHEGPGKVACFIAEPIQGVGGVVDPPPEYFKIVYDIVRAHDGLCIADEVQTGFGRTGRHFWGFQNWGVVPDAVTMAKGIGNGAPLGACTTRPEVAKTMAQKHHFNTFGGNPVSMIQGLTTLEIIDSEGLQQNSLEIGGYLKERLLDLQKQHRIIGEVRGKGLMLGAEIVTDPDTREPGTQLADQITEGVRERGLLIGRGGWYGNVLRIKPPMCITRQDADFLIDCLDEVLLSVG
ncbi:MAG TPA: aspartate aminotransferase family protein [Phycisphaerae bacterium]|nr:aspartate aminotransferase family protein [Phycisphaerae bacterium]